MLRNWETAIREKLTYLLLRVMSAIEEHIEYMNFRKSVLNMKTQKKERDYQLLGLYESSTKHFGTPKPAISSRKLK